MMPVVLRSLAGRAARNRFARLVPMARVLLIAELALLAKRHLDLLSPAERRRLVSLVRKGRSLSRTEQTELRALAMKVDPAAFARTAVAGLSPIPLPDRLVKPARPS